MRVISPQALLRRALADPQSPAGAMRVTEFLTSIPAIGEGKRDRILQELEISPVKKLGGLGARQRRALRAVPRRALARAGSARRAQPPRRPRRTHGRRQGHGRRAHQGASSRDPPVGLGDDAAAAARRGRRRALLLRRRRRVRSAGRGRRAARARHRAQQVPLRHSAAPDRRGARAPGAPCCSRSTCRARARCATPSRPRRSCSCCRRAGTNSSSGSSAEAPKEPRSGPGRLRTAKVELASQNEFDFRVVNEDVASAARDVVELVKAPAR